MPGTNSIQRIIRVVGDHLMLFMTVDIVLDGQKWRTPIIVRIKYV